MKELDDLRVLLVEDNEIDARSLQRMLERDTSTNFHIERAADIAGALATLGEGAYDCILLDLSLPDSEGIESIDRVVDASPAAPIVVLTGHDDPRAAVEAVDHGAQDYLFKQTIDTESAGRSIRYAVARYYAEQQLFAAQARLRVMDDRDRIARDLHDTVIQQLFATGMTLQATLARIDNPAARSTVNECVDGIDTAIAQLRHAIFELHQAPDQLGDDMAQIVRSAVASLGFEPTLTVNRGEQSMPVSSGVRRDLAATLREALANVAHHAEASATAITLDIDATSLTLTVADNGRGATPGGETGEFRGNGLANMDRRATNHGGWFRFESASGGSTVRWSVPNVDS